MRFVAITVLGLSIAGCAGPQIWLRVDGQRGAADPILAQQFEIARTSCTGERQKATLSGVTVSSGGVAGLAAAVEREQSANQVLQGCMADKGYLLVPEEQAEAKQRELEAVEAERKRREAAAAAVAPARKK